MGRFLSKEIPYKGTSISVEQSKMDIEMMLKEFGVVALRWTETPESIRGVELATLEFIVETELKGVKKQIGFRIQPPLLTEKRRRGGRYGPVVETPAPMQSMRLLFWWLKSKLESVRYGLETIEKTLLSKVMIQLPSGEIQTVGETIETQLALPKVDSYKPSPIIRNQKTESADGGLERADS